MRTARQGRNSIRVRRLRLALLGSVLGLFALLPGCGGGTNQPADPVAAVHKTANEMVGDLLKGDYEGFCGLYTAEARATFDGSGCAKKVGAVMLLGGEQVKAQVRQIARDFDSSRVTVRGNTAVMHTPHGAANFVYEGRRWLVTGGFSIGNK